MPIRPPWVPSRRSRTAINTTRAHSRCEGRLFAVFGALILAAGLAGEARTGEPRAFPALDKIPVPPALAGVPAAERLDTLIASLDEDKVFFNYLLNIYIKIPTLSGQAPAGAPRPDEALRRLAERRRVLEAESPPPDPNNTEAIIAALKEKPFRQWLRVVGLLASGKRALNAGRGDDGGEEYFLFFRYSDALAKEDPALLFAVLSEFCQFGARPPRSRLISPIHKGRDTAGLFLPAVLSADHTVKREPDLARLAPFVIDPPLLERSLERIAPEAWASFPALNRTAGLLAGYHRARIGRAPAGRDGVEGFASLVGPVSILRACIGHEAFKRLPEVRRAAIQGTLEAFEAEAARREKDAAPLAVGAGEADGAADLPAEK